MSTWSFSDLNLDFEMLRATLEGALTAPAVVAVCSAQVQDGKSLTAFGLAANLAQAGHRVVLVDASKVRPAARLEPLNERTFTDLATGVEVLPFSGAAREQSAKQLRTVLDGLRSRYDYVVFDTDRLPASGLALKLATLADGVLLTCRVGRMPNGDDQFLMRALENARARVLGVITATLPSIRSFAERKGATAPEPRVRTATEPASIIRESATVESTIPHRVVGTTS